MIIDKFKGPFSFLSNFYETKVEVEGITYPSSEHAYQALKTYSVDERKLIATARTPGHAKRMGQKVKMRSTWHIEKYGAMEHVLRCKFAQNHLLRSKLMETGSIPLVEGNTWGDRIWGVCDGTGSNALGLMLMKLRAEYLQFGGKRILLRHDESDSYVVTFGEQEYGQLLDRSREDLLDVTGIIEHETAYWRDFLEVKD